MGCNENDIDAIRMIVKVTWCDACSKWHYRHWLLLPSPPESGQLVACLSVAELTAEQDQMGFGFAEFKVGYRELVRLTAELEHGQMALPLDLQQDQVI